MNIPLMDLKAQYRSIRDEVLKAVEGVLEGGRYILGPEVKALEEEVAALCGVDHGVGVANGTDALVLVLDALGIGPGDEVITTPFTFFATAESISRVGATPVFVDIDPGTFNLDASELRSRITPRTKAILPVHIFGQPADMDEVMEVAKESGLWVIEDACQAIGAEYRGRKVGSLGHAACFSFFPTKNLGGYGDGGMIVTDDESLARKLRSLRVHGRTPESKYINTMLGYNSRLDELQAAILRIKLRRLKEWNEARRRKAHLYNELLQDLPIVTPVEASDRSHIYHLYIIQAEERDALIEHLNRHGIASGVYYPIPLHLQEVYRFLEYGEGSLPRVEKVAKRTLALPLYPEMTEESVRYVAEVVRRFFQRG
jgi:dTDP-4-amino-4,6-dideoxygalactose transaminase